MFVLGGLCALVLHWFMVLVLVLPAVVVWIRLLLQMKRRWLLFLAESVCMDWQLCIYG